MTPSFPFANSLKSAGRWRVENTGTGGAMEQLSDPVGNTKIPIPIAIAPKLSSLIVATSPPAQPQPHTLAGSTRVDKKSKAAGRAAHGPAIPQSPLPRSIGTAECRNPDRGRARPAPYGTASVSHPPRVDHGSTHPARTMIQGP